ncbi:Abi family protein [Erysipelothrix rhusiopathiae]|nr:Abi family protein [Erysipelothrix rhusiopathiae]MDE8314263.1 Abi family protein [Erysipelothrix rhusiopathiae]
MDYDKPFRTVEEQLLLLTERNLVVTQESYSEDVNTLRIIPYHSLINGYKHLFQTKDNYFKSNVTLATLKITYILNNELNNLILNNIIHIEKQMKNSIAHRIAEQFGVHTNMTPLPTDKFGKVDRSKILVSNVQGDYLSRNNYNGKYVVGTLSKIIALIKCPYENTLIYHYVNNNNHIPPWILLNDLSFGYSIKLYRIFKGVDKEYVVNNMFCEECFSQDQSNELFVNSMCQLEEFRNIVAHGNKSNGVFYRSELPKFLFTKIYYKNNIITEDEWKKGIGKKDITSILLISIIFLNDLTLATRLYDSIQKLILNNDTNYAGMNIYEILNLPVDILYKMEKTILYKYNFSFIK